MTDEQQVYRFAVAKLETLLEKNIHMDSFLLRVFREVETSFVTTTDVQQCALQTVTLASE